MQSVVRSSEVAHASLQLCMSPFDSRLSGLRGCRAVFAFLSMADAGRAAWPVTVALWNLLISFVALPFCRLEILHSTTFVFRCLQQLQAASTIILLGEVGSHEAVSFEESDHGAVDAHHLGLAAMGVSSTSSYCSAILLFTIFTVGKKSKKHSPRHRDWHQATTTSSIFLTTPRQS